MHQKFIKMFIKTFLAFILISLLGGTFSSLTHDGLIDRLSYNLIDYNKITYVENEQPPILSVTKTAKKIKSGAEGTFTDLFSEFHYNSLVNAGRMVVDSNTTFKSYNSDIGEYNIKLVGQNTFSIDAANIGGELDSIYHMDSGQFYTYFNNIVAFHRGAADAFLFISDTLADKLVDKYNIEGETKLERYQKLITDSQYAFISLSFEGSDTIILGTINNVIHSNYENGISQRVEELYGENYALTWLTRIGRDPTIKVSFEVELKTNPYTTKTVLKKMEAYGYSYDNATYEMRIFNSKIGKYEVSQYYTNKINEITNYKYNVLFYVLFALTCLLAIVINYFISIKLEGLDYECLLIFGLLIAAITWYGIIVTFTYSYPLFIIVPIIFIVAFFIFNYKEINVGFKKLFKKYNGPNIRKNYFYEIKI